MKSVNDLHIRVIDKGIFVPVARRLARDVRQVSYWSPHEEAFESVRKQIGDGFPDIVRVRSMFQNKNDVDCFVFVDVGFPDEQLELISQGFPVWGAREGDSLEMSRGKFMDALMSTDLLVPKYQKVIGMEALREYLKPREDQFIKISKFRGDWETLHFRDWRQDEMELDARAVKLGPWKEVIPFYVFENIETKIEDGCDTYCIDGKFPSLIIHGMEAKDKAFLGTFQRFDDLPEEVRCVNDEFGPILAGYGYRSFFSTEVRITEDGKTYFIDPTCRAGSPPSQVMTEMIGNYADIMWRGAQGELVDPEPAYKFGVQGLVCVKGDRHAWSTIEIPTELDQWLKCGFCCQIDDRLCFPPDREATGGDVGWLVGVGQTAKEAIEHLKHNAEMLPCGVTCEYTAIADLLKEVEQAEESGMEFSDQQMPKPEIVLNGVDK